MPSDPNRTAHWFNGFILNTLLPHLVHPPVLRAVRRAFKRLVAAKGEGVMRADLGQGTRAWQLLVNTVPTYLGYLEREEASCGNVLVSTYSHQV